MSNPFQAEPHLHAVLMSAEDESWLKVKFNGVDMFLPAGTIVTMAHCVALDGKGGLVLDVENAHLQWMKSKLKPGSVFLDVGAATGAMTVPISFEFPGVEIIAFEPAERARRLLTATLIKNDKLGAKVRNTAISDVDGVISFADRPVSADGSVPFLPETSTIVKKGANDLYGPVVEVPTRRLDTIAIEYGIRQRRVVMKMDIEGYEIQALAGAEAFLRNNDVSLAIDIHVIPGKTAETTEADCRAKLHKCGYRTLPMMGHVLLAERA
jgi:FkbM family methyltransferase